MGNCQAAEASTVVILHPGCKIQRIYWSVSVNEVMTSYPGHYVALIITSPTAKSENGKPLKRLKLLRPDDTLHIGQVYRLISFEEVLKEFAAKKCVKLGRLLKETGKNSVVENRKDRGDSKPSSDLEKRKVRDPKPSLDLKISNSVIREGHRLSSSSSGSRVGRQQHYQGGGGQWKPALQSIEEVGN